MPKKTKKCNLEAIPIPDPDVKPYTAWVRKERLAWLVSETLRLGSSRLINRTQTAALFGVSIPVISTDIKDVDAYIGRALDADTATSMLYASFQKAHGQLLAEERFAQAYKLARDFCDYLQTLGVIAKAADELVVDMRSGNIQVVFTNAEDAIQQPNDVDEE